MIALPLWVIAIIAGGGVVMKLTWPVAPGRHRMPPDSARHRYERDARGLSRA